MSDRHAINPGPAPESTSTPQWRSLHELAEPRPVPPEPPQPALMETDELGRRRFLQVMGASIALGAAAGTGCRRPELKVLPYSKRPSDVVPGQPTFYATAMPRAGAVFPVLAEGHEGRPTKIEGNPGWADSGGASDTWAQASVLGLYDPDRSKDVLRYDADHPRGQATGWDAFDRFAAGHFAGLKAANGKGLRFLAGEVNSPSLDRVREGLAEAYPESKWHAFEPFGPDNERAGMAIAGAKGLRARHRLDEAKVIVVLDGDPLGAEDDGVRLVRGYAKGRRAERPSDPMNRLYVVEPQFTPTGGMADHRLRLAASQIGGVARALAAGVGVAGAEGGRTPAGVDPAWIREAAADLKAAGANGAVIVGRRQPPWVHALGLAINAQLGAIGTTVDYYAEPGAPAGTLAELAEAIQANEVTTLVVLGGNPVYGAPADLDLATLIEGVPTTIRLGMHADETSARCGWHLPERHYLESWGDGRTSDGTVAAIQPLIEPLYPSRCVLAAVATMAGLESTDPYEIVRATFRGDAKDVDEAAWRAFLHGGLKPESAAKPAAAPAVDAAGLAKALAEVRVFVPPTADFLELMIYPCPKVGDGRYANNGWLQEAPDPITKLTWDNAALIGPATAEALGVGSEQIVALEVGTRGIEVPVLVVPGQAEWTIGLAAGYGRSAEGLTIAGGAGSNAGPLRTTGAPDVIGGVRLTRTIARKGLALTQEHHSMEGRDLARVLGPGEEPEPEARFPDIQERPVFDGEHQWGMAVDLNTCVGCNACTVACQAENNVPIVGRDEVARGREMHWIRIDRYFEGEDGADPSGMVTQPVMCQHCESAPCEVVCPVNASVHNEEGLNLQAYNRCIGTRYCANNCPYKVRRFNFFNYNERPLTQLRLGPLAEKGMADQLQMQKNPDVTVRIRGVMEKCTYCVQRIERARIGTRTEAGASDAIRVPDGAVVPACAQACPAEAIVFGDVSDPNSRVSKLKKQARDYWLLHEVNAKPRTSYLARMRNPNPRLAPAGAATEAEIATTTTTTGEGDRA